jgi:uncharacterized protein (DUF2141 family)
MKEYRVLAILALSFFLLVCSKTKNPVMDAGEDQPGLTYKSFQSSCGEDSKRNMVQFQFDYFQGECKAYMFKGTPDACTDTLEDSVSVWFSANKIWVVHKNAFENCCSVILTDVIQTTQGFDVYEQDTAANLCYCLCYFDILTSIQDVSPGVYLIRVFDTAGSLVGEDAVVVPFQGDTVIFSSHADTILVIHQDAFYNCCSEILVNVVQTEEGFDLFERDTSGEACHCMCDFDITTIISGVSEGSYLVRLFDIYGNLVDSEAVYVSPN